MLFVQGALLGQFSAVDLQSIGDRTEMPFCCLALGIFMRKDGQTHGQSLIHEPQSLDTVPLQTPGTVTKGMA